MSTCFWCDYCYVHRFLWDFVDKVWVEKHPPCLKKLHEVWRAVLRSNAAFKFAQLFFPIIVVENERFKAKMKTKQHPELWPVFHNTTASRLGSWWRQNYVGSQKQNKLPLIFPIQQLCNSFHQIISGRRDHCSPSAAFVSHSILPHRITLASPPPPSVGFNTTSQATPNSPNLYPLNL